MFSDINLITWISLFVVYLLIDILYTQYVMAIAKLNAFWASNISVLLYILTAYGTIEYVQNYWNIIPIVIGSWLGTYVTLRYEIHKKNKKKIIQEKFRVNRLF